MTDAFAVRERSRIFQLEQKVRESWVSEGELYQGKNGHGEYRSNSF